MLPYNINISHFCSIILLLASPLLKICSGQVDVSDFRRSLLDCHNKFRGTHASDPIKLDDELNVRASKIAEKAGRDKNFKELNPGENAYMSCATFRRDVNGEEVANAWYGEVCKPRYNFKDVESNKNSRSFTQMIWKDTQRLGVGRAIVTDKGGEICTYIIGIYRPPGNLKGFFGENVEKGTFNADSYCPKMSVKKSTKYVKRNKSHKL